MVISEITPEYPVIGWWSGGGDSAIACKKCLEWFGPDSVRIVFIDTRNEDDDTYRFKKDCENWYGKEIETICTDKWDNIEDVWDHYLSLTVAGGAICSTELKREVRKVFQNKNKYSYQAFGYDINEIDRAKALRINYPDSKPIFPIIYELMSKTESLKLLQKNNIIPPLSYQMGYSNNNCLKTGCVQGGIGYWQKYKVDFPDRFESMGIREHRYTNEKGVPVTILKDQSKEARLKNGGKPLPVFLIPHPEYPFVKDITMIEGRMSEPLMECNGFCGPSQDILSHIQNSIGK